MQIAIYSVPCEFYAAHLSLNDFLNVNVKNSNQNVKSHVKNQAMRKYYIQ